MGKVLPFQPYGAASLPGLRIPGVSGVYGDDERLVLNAGQKAFLRKLRKQVDFDFVVTSGVRSLAEQASAMYTKLRNYGYASLVNLYPDSLVAGMQSATSSDDILRILKQRIREGAKVSDHLVGEAVDIRTRTLNDTQIRALMRAAEALGARPGWEEDHLHIGDIAGRKWWASPWLWASVGVSVIGLAVVVRVATRKK